MKIDISPSKQEDWQTIQKLNIEVYEHDQAYDDDLDMSQPFSEGAIEHYKDLAAGKSGYCLIARDEDKPAGYIALNIKHFSYRKSAYVEIGHMGVSPEYRSQGIGHQLIEAAKKWAQEQHATRLYVAAYWGNTGAINFYKKVGFKEMGIELEMPI